MTISDVPWWKNATVYQIYPASFKDSNGDGVGDIPGIISELDYIASLGVDVIWVCPMYDSPQVDMGYDISNYESVYPPYGTLQDMDVLIYECHQRGIRIILDLVINHTSDQHAWFKESRSSKTNPKRDWYMWKPPKFDEQGNRHPPNNWRSCFGGSAWQWDEATQEYYLHLFCPEQPDLNWENAETRQAIYDSAMRFWLRKGVDGFRVDTVNLYSKPPGLPDAEVTDPGSEWQYAGDVYANGPRMHEYLREMNRILQAYGAMTVGELPHTHEIAKVLKYVSAKEEQLSMVFQFDAVNVGCGISTRYDITPRNWKLAEMKAAFQRIQDLIRGTDGWTTAFMENHDQARSISRFGNDSDPLLWEKSGKMLAVMLGTMSGTLYVYQGQEIGMINAPKTWSMDEYKDVESSNYYREVGQRTSNDPAALAHARAALQHLARDHSRMPMQWDSSENAGFTTSKKPWMRVNDGYKQLNVQGESSNKNSILNFWRDMIRIRRENLDLFVHGLFDIIDPESETIFAYKKTAASGRQAIVYLNFGETPKSIGVIPGKRLVGNYDGPSQEILRPYEAVVHVID